MSPSREEWPEQDTTSHLWAAERPNFTELVLELCDFLLIPGILSVVLCQASLDSRELGCGTFTLSWSQVCACVQMESPDLVIQA